MLLHRKHLVKNFVAVHETKRILTLDKPIYVRFSIFNLSRLLMHEVHFKCIKRKYNSNLFFTDRGSLVYEVKTDYVYEDFYRDKNSFYFSDWLSARFKVLWPC